VKLNMKTEVPRVIGQIIGVGTDIESVQRFAAVPFHQNEPFYHNLFHEKEIEYCLQRPNPPQSFAARFAAKESVIKACSEIISLSCKDIIITSNKNHSPIAKILKEGFQRTQVKMSMSHTKEFATAIAVVMEEIRQK